MSDTEEQTLGVPKSTEEMFGELMKSNKEVMSVVKETVVAMQKMQHDNAVLQKDMFESFRLAQITKRGPIGDGRGPQQHANTQHDPQQHVPERIKMSEQPTEDDGHGHNTFSFNQGSRPSTSRAKPNRPKVESDLDEMGWEIFLDSFRRYKRIANLESNEDVCLELREACSANVNKSLYQYIGAVDLNSPTLTEAKLMEYIKFVAVKPIHPEVHRWNFNGLTQNEGEPVAQFVGRLKGEAALCRFSVKCTCDRDVSYADEMISQRLVSGLVNTEHQSKLLSEAKELDTLLKKVDRIMSLETTDDATTQIRVQSRISVAKSQYKKLHKTRPSGGFPSKPSGGFKPKPSGGFPSRGKSFDSRKKPAMRCRGCGKHDHGPKKTMNRSDCSALGHTCKSCGKQNHFESVCEARKSHVSFARNLDDSTDESSYEDEADYEYTEDSDSEDDHQDETTTNAASHLDFRHGRARKPFM